MKILFAASFFTGMLVTAYFLATEFPNLNSFSGSIYFALMVVLLMICILGMMINMPKTPRKRIKLRM